MYSKFISRKCEKCDFHQIYHDIISSTYRELKIFHLRMKDWSMNNARQTIGWGKSTGVHGGSWFFWGHFSNFCKFRMTNFGYGPESNPLISWNWIVTLKKYRESPPYCVELHPVSRQNFKIVPQIFIKLRANKSCIALILMNSTNLGLLKTIVREVLARKCLILKVVPLDKNLIDGPLRITIQNGVAWRHHEYSWNGGARISSGTCSAVLPNHEQSCKIQLSASLYK